jgi:hypothetical protein
LVSAREQLIAAAGDRRLAQVSARLAAGDQRGAIRALESASVTITEHTTAQALLALARDLETETGGRQRRVCQMVIHRAESAINRLPTPAAQQVIRSATAIVPMCTVIGGHGLAARPGDMCELVFTSDALRILAPSRSMIALLPLSEITAIEVGGPGVQRTGGGYVGGGFGLSGAAEGMLIAAALNRLTTKITIRTVICIQTPDAELFVNHTSQTPESLRMHLSPVFTALRRRSQATASTAPESGSEADPLDVLRKLGALRDAGLLTEEEFEAKKADLLRRL